MYPGDAVAASFVPSLEEAMSLQNPLLALEVHDAPESLEVQMYPGHCTAASLVPSPDDVMSPQYGGLEAPVTDRSVKVASAGAIAQNANSSARR